MPDGASPPPPDPHVRVVRVLPDPPAIDKTFDYLVPDELGHQVRVGSMVRVTLHGRRVGGWVVADRVGRDEREPPRALQPIAKVTGWGPSDDVIDLAHWAAWRWAGRPAHFLRTASPDHATRQLPSAGAPAAPIHVVPDDLLTDAFALERAVLRLPPARDPYAVVLAAAARGNALVLCPSADGARHLGLRLRRAGLPVAIMPRDWALARAGATVVGTRAAAWAPVRELAAVVVLDEHDEVWQQEQAPTWNARDVAAERARRAGVACILVSPVPSLEAQQWGTMITPSRGTSATGGPRSTSSTAATTTRVGPGCSPSGSSPCCAAERGCCACSTARDVLGCWPVPRAARWPTASGASPWWCSPTRACSSADDAVPLGRPPAWPVPGPRSRTSEPA